MAVSESNVIKFWSLKALENPPKEFNLSLSNITYIKFDKNSQFIFASNNQESEFLSIKEEATIHAIKELTTPYLSFDGKLMFGASKNKLSMLEFK